jgi:hypothetical protein
MTSCPEDVVRRHGSEPAFGVIPCFRFLFRSGWRLTGERSGEQREAAQDSNDLRIHESPRMVGRR